MRELAVTMRIGGAVAGSFRTALGGAAGDVRALGAAIRGLEQDPGRLRFERFTTLKRSLGDVRQELAVAEQDLRQATAEIERAGSASREMASRQRAAERRVEALRGKFREQAASLRSVRAEMRDAGESVEGLAERYRRLSAAAERARTVQARLAQIQSQQQALASQRSEMHGQMLGAVAMGAAMAWPIKEAIEFESKMADVRKVVDFPTPQAFAEMRTEIQRMVTEQGIPMTAGGIAEIVSAAGQAGIAREELTRFAADAARMGVAFDMAAGDAGSAMTGMRSIFKLTQDQAVLLGDSFNYLSNNMDAKARDIVDISHRVGSTARVFGLSGQQLGALGATMLALKTPPEVASTGIDALLNRLANADKQSDAFQGTLARIGLSAEGLKEHIGRDAQGALLAFLEAAKSSGDLQGVMFDVGGQEYSKHFVKLVDGLDQYKKALGLVNKETEYAGSMQQEFASRAATTDNALIIFRNQVTRVATAIGSVLLPPLNAVLGVFGQAVNGIAGLAEHFPGLTKAVSVAAFGFVGLRLASFALRYSWTFLKGGILDLMKAYWWLTGQTAVNTAATTVNAGASRASGLAAMWSAARTRAAALAHRAAAIATGIWTGAQWALNVAMTANPIGLLIAGAALLAGVGIWLLSKWQPVRELFATIWEWGKRLLGLGDVSADIAQGAAMPEAGSGGLEGMDTGSFASGYSAAPPGSLPVSPSAMGAGGGSISVEFKPTINITAPGGDPKAVRAAADQALQVSERRLEEMIENILRRKERLSFG